MRHTGILAANPDGAARCFLTYCRAGAERLGGHVYPDITLDYIAFGHSLRAWQAGDAGTATANLARSVDSLAAAGADFFVCPDNTAHLVLDRMANLALPGLHIGAVLADEAAERGARRVAVLGTAFITGSAFAATWLGTRGIDAASPDPADRERLDGIILGELVDGRATEESRSWCIDLVGRLAEQGCDAVALASTELPLLLPAERSPLPVIDPTAALGRRALAIALGDVPLPTWRGGP